MGREEKTEHSAGCIAYKQGREGPLFAMMVDRFGRWTFPKGHVEEGEAAFAAARRELAEEIGLDKVELTTRLGESEHEFEKDGETVRKRTEWFLVEAEPEAEIHAKDTEHVKEAAWVGADDAAKRLGYGNLRRIFNLAKGIVEGI